MSRGTFQILAIIAAVAIVATLSLTVVATGNGSMAKQGGDFLHGIGQQLHGGGGHHDQMSQLIEQLELTPDQARHMEKIHESMGAFHHGPASMSELHEKLMAQFGSGRLDTGEIQKVIDDHVEQVRFQLYGVTDEMVALVNGLDETQRSILSSHLHGDHAGHDGDGH